MHDIILVLKIFQYHSCLSLSVMSHFFLSILMKSWIVGGLTPVVQLLCRIEGCCCFCKQALAEWNSWSAVRSSSPIALNALKYVNASPSQSRPECGIHRAKCLGWMKGFSHRREKWSERAGFPSLAPDLMDASQFCEESCSVIKVLPCAVHRSPSRSSGLDRSETMLYGGSMGQLNGGGSVYLPDYSVRQLTHLQVIKV